MTFPQIRSNPARLKLHNGFGLVEMLVAIVLVAILVAVLVPVMGNAVESSRAAQCMSNLRFFHSALHAYTVENGGLLPPYRNAKTISNAYEWRRLLVPYIPHKPYRNKLKDGSIDACPSADFQSSNSYTFYYALTADSTFANPKATRQIQSPAQYFVLGDSGGQMRVDRLSGTKDFSFRHKGRANLLFLDGHVESRLPEEIPTRSGTPEYNRFWLGR